MTVPEALVPGMRAGSSYDKGLNEGQSYGKCWEIREEILFLFYGKNMQESSNRNLFHVFFRLRWAEVLTHIDVFWQLARCDWWLPSAASPIVTSIFLIFLMLNHFWLTIQNRQDMFHGPRWLNHHTARRMVRS